jgi:glutamyl-tRNA synthetase
MSQRVRVRFAPSPTGPLHIGGVRTALFNYLFAKKHQGDFLLRIEDTDQTRYVEGAEAYIIEALEWLNIPFDEGPGKEGSCGPYRQSERKQLYRAFADRLIAEGKAYFAFDTAEELQLARKEAEAKGETFIYNHGNRDQLKNAIALSSETVEKMIAEGEEYVIRFKSPAHKTLEINDIIRGSLQIDTNTLDDKVLFKSDGMPTYHLANIVDDHLMQITHVIRGEEWLPSLPLHQMLYQAFGWEAPLFAHLPLIMKPVGKGKLSKRDGEAGGYPVYPLQWKTDTDNYMGYREEGYFPNAVINMLALLGWNPGTEQELFSLEELTQQFSLDRVHKSGAKFDPEKTKWFQHQYLQDLSDEELVAPFETLLKSKQLDVHIDVLKVISLVKERATFIHDLWEQASFFFVAPSNFDEKSAQKVFKDDTPALLQEVIEILKTVENFNVQSLSESVKSWITSEGIGFGKVMMPLRLALVGEMKGPDVFEILSVLGKKDSISRIELAISSIG